MQGGRILLCFRSLLSHWLPTRVALRYGMRMGFDMRQQAVAAVQAKVLRLNSVAVADQTAGKVRRLHWYVECWPVLCGWQV